MIDPRVTPLPESIPPRSYPATFARNLANIRDVFDIDVVTTKDSPVYKSNQVFSYVEYLRGEDWSEMMRQSFPALANGLSLDYALDILDVARKPGESDELLRARRHETLHALAPSSLDGIRYIITQFNPEVAKLQVTTDFSYLMTVYPARSDSQSLTTDERTALQQHLNSPRTGGYGDGFRVQPVTRQPYRILYTYHYRSLEHEEPVITRLLRQRIYAHVAAVAEPGRSVSREIVLALADGIPGIVDADASLGVPDARGQWRGSGFTYHDLAAVAGRIPLCLQTEVDVEIRATDDTPPAVI